MTFFSYHFHQPGQRSKQKAINLNANVFVDEFYPGLRDRLAELHFGLTVLGPGNAGPYRLSRKALRTQGAKNWRLDGELINDPPDESGRFEVLTDGDLAVIAFEGTEQPEQVTLVLVSQTDDEELYREISLLVTFSGRETMQAIAADQLASVLRTTLTAYTGGHPLEPLFGADSVEEAVHGSAQAQENVATSGDGRGVMISPESVRRQAATAGEVGQRGEEAFEQWLGTIGYPKDQFEWVARTNARAAYDFIVDSPPWEDGGGRFFVDVKSTKGRHDAPFHMSMAEVRWAAAHEEYRVARVSSLTSSSAQIRVLRGISELCCGLLAAVDASLPDGISIDSFEISPGLLREITGAAANWTEVDDET